MEEIKETTVFFKRSIVEHFGEELLTSLCNINSLEDYHNLDISILYNLLRNVCKNVTPPKRGWGYEPSADDESLGADIERIRSIWNRHCDGETEFSYLEEILVRMIYRYGNILDVVKFEDTGRKKILSFAMNPGCQEEDGVVLTKALKAVLDILEQEYCVVVKGAVGTGKSTCLKYIDRHYRRNQWKVKKKEGSITQSDVYVPVDEKRTLLCDDLFGVYNRGYFGGTNDIIKALENIEQKVNKNMKVVLAIHDHVYEELQKSHYIKVFQNKRIVVDFNEHSDAEMLLIFNDQRKKGHCSKNPKCWFRNVDFESIKNTLKENTGKLGSPILTLLYSNLHDTFAQKKDTQDRVKILCFIFQNMMEKNPDLFHVLLYVMFVETHSLDENVKEWASKLWGLNSTTVEQNVCHVDAFPFVQADGRKIKIKHELLSFALFKWCASNIRYAPLLLKHCQFQMIEEIIRPINSSHQSEFCVILKDEMFCVLISRILDENLNVHVKKHPLMKNDLFKKLVFQMLRKRFT
uniref:DZIP3-like HEPN domain-containing protein n=1 Tax=Magallana gigas TaxID=29159 RepID=A0A8W8JUD5_MAGGI|nr:uncharacterized protein LOC109619320 [Crassostrea gigas]